MVFIFFDIKGIIYTHYADIGAKINSSYIVDILWQLPQGHQEDVWVHDGLGQLDVVLGQCALSLIHI